MRYAAMIKLHFTNPINNKKQRFVDSIDTCISEKNSIINNTNTCINKKNAHNFPSFFPLCT